MFGNVKNSGLKILQRKFKMRSSKLFDELSTYVSLVDQISELKDLVDLAKDEGILDDGSIPMSDDAIFFARIAIY